MHSIRGCIASISDPLLRGNDRCSLRGGDEAGTSEHDCRSQTQLVTERFGLVPIGGLGSQHSHLRAMMSTSSIRREKADEGEGCPAWIDGRIAEAIEVSVATIERVGQRFVEQGLEAALVRKPQARLSRLPTLDGGAEARLIALARSAPPDGRSTWTMQMLADKQVELQVVPMVCDEKVRRALKKTRKAKPD